MKKKSLICLSLSLLLGGGLVGSLCLATPNGNNETRLVKGDGDGSIYRLTLSKDNKIHFDEDSDSAFIYTSQNNQVGVSLTSYSESASGLITLKDGTFKNMDAIHDIKSIVVNYSGSGSLKGYLGFYVYGAGGGEEIDLTSGSKFIPSSSSSYFALISEGEVNIESIVISYDCTVFTEGPSPIKVSISELNKVVELSKKSNAYKGVLYEIEGGLSSFRKVNAHGNGILTNPLTGDSVSIVNLGTLKDGSNGGMLEAEFTNDKYKFNERRSFDADTNYSNFKDGVYLKGYALLTGEYETSVNLAITDLEADYSYPAVISVTGEKDKFKGITYKVNDEEVTLFKYGDKVTATLSLDEGYTAVSKVNGTLAGFSSTFTFESSAINKIEIEVKVKSEDPELLSTYMWGKNSGSMASQFLSTDRCDISGDVEALQKCSSKSGWKLNASPNYLTSITYNGGDRKLSFVTATSISRIDVLVSSESEGSTLILDGDEKTVSSSSKDQFATISFGTKLAKGDTFTFNTKKENIHIKSMSFYAYL